MARGGCPRLRQHFRIVDRDLHDEVVLRRTRNALDDAQLVAVKPRAGIVDERSLVEPDRFDDERVALPAGRTVAVKQRLRVLGVRASIGVDDAEVVEHFDELHQQSWRLNELDRVRVTEPDGREAARNAIHRPLRELALCRRHALHFCRRPGLERRRFLWCHVGIELPERRPVHRHASIFHVRDAGSIGPPHARQIRTPVRGPRRRAARWHDPDRFLRAGGQGKNGHEGQRDGCDPAANGKFPFHGLASSTIDHNRSRSR